MAIGKRVALVLLAVIVIVALFILYYSTGREPEDAWRHVALPDISRQPLALRVVYARNPRFVDLSEAQLQNILQQTTRLMKLHFAVDVVFETKPSLNVEQLFALLPEQVRKQRQSAIVNPQGIDQKEIAQLRQVLFRQLSSYQGDPQNLIDYARPYLLTNEPVTNLASLSHALVDTMLTRLRYWYEDRAADGQPIIDGSPYNQWVWWDSLGYGDLSYDVVMTNQLVASLEAYDVAMHSALRGGINGGTMTYSKQGRYGGYVFVSVFAMLNDMDLLASLRDDAHYSDTQITQYVAATLAHELGHLFFHYDHPFAASECLMNPTPLLRYRAWYEGLNAEACRARQLPQMQLGAAQIGYNLNW